MINSFEPNFQKIAKTNSLQEKNLCPDHHKNLVSEKHKKSAICKNLFLMVFHADFWLSNYIYGKNKRLEMTRVKTFMHLCNNSAETITLDFIT